MNNWLRIPSEYEKEQIKKYISKRNSRLIKLNKRIATVSGVFCGIFIISVDFSDIRNSIGAIILVVLCFLLTFCMVKNKNTLYRENQEYLKGSYKISDGYVSKKENCPNAPGCINVWFQPNFGSMGEGWYKVRQESVELSSPLLMVCPDDKTFRCRVFTKYMLTDDCID